MNKNLQRLNELVMETNKVIENLKQDTEEIKEDNTARRIERYKEIYQVFLECKEIADKLAPYEIRVKAKGEHSDRLAKNVVHKDFGKDEISEKGIYIVYNKHKKYYYSQEDISHEILMGSGYAIYENHALYRVPDEYKEEMWDSKTYANMIDNWDREDFEMKFMAEVERVIKEKAEKANVEYNKATNAQDKLKEVDA